MMFGRITTLVPALCPAENGWFCNTDILLPASLVSRISVVEVKPKFFPLCFCVFSSPRFCELQEVNIAEDIAIVVSSIVLIFMSLISGALLIDVFSRC